MESQRLHQRYRRCLLISVPATVTALAGLIAAGFQEPRGRHQMLPDGTVLEYVGSTFGRDHTIGVGNWWQRLYGFLFPLRAPVLTPLPRIGIYPRSSMGLSRSPLAPRAPSPPVMIGSRAHFISANDEPVLWFRRTFPPRRAASGEVRDQRWTAAIDSHGCRIPCGVDKVDVPTLMNVGSWPGHPEEQLVLAEVRNYNRRESRFRFAFFESDSEAPVAEFPAANPQIVHPKEWLAASLPVRSQQAGMTFALDELTHLQVVRAGITETARFVPLRGRTRAPFWDVKHAEVRDATGNVWPAFLLTGNRAFFGGLCRKEPAWMITAGFEEGSPGRDPPDFTWRFQDIPVPAAGKSVRYDRSAGQGDKQLTITRISVPGTVERQYHGPSLEYRLPTGSGPDVALLAVTDEKDRDLLGGGWASYRVMAAGWHGTLDLPPMRDARYVRIVLGGFRPRHAEFFVRP